MNHLEWVTRTQKSEIYSSIRHASEELTSSLEWEDFLVQGMPDVSPAKWHLAHTTWFFETFFLEKFDSSYRPYHPQFNYLFNSYYNSRGERHARPARGVLSRPTATEIFSYRHAVDQAMIHYLEEKNDALSKEEILILETGLNHEQQHQELLLTDIKYNFSLNPLKPAYLKSDVKPHSSKYFRDKIWFEYPGGLYSIGHQGTEFAFDHEKPVHLINLLPFRLSSHLVTNGDFLQFMADGGYERPELWLSDGWEIVEKEKWHAPLYWNKDDGHNAVFTLSGNKRLALNEPVCHVSFYEVDAYARWAGKRLPTEFEWEAASQRIPVSGNFYESGKLHPVAFEAKILEAPVQLYGDVWEWTSSPYIRYPGFKPNQGALGEYNAKFMSNQMVLRGGSCVTSQSHIRPSYRNFFYPHQRWQFMGFRLAEDSQ